jgi:hypothetical protein
MMETKVTRYQSYSGTIASGDTFVINRQGRSVTCLSASDDLEIVIDDGSRSFFTAGISMEFDDAFAKVQLHNPTAGPVTFLIATAMGKVDDNRLTASGEIKVLDPGAGGESFADVIASQAAILAMMQNAQDQRAGVTDLTNCQFFEAAGATITALTAAANTNGAIIRYVSAEAGNGSGSALRLDGNVLVGCTLAGSGLSGALNGKDFYVPAGVEIELYSASSNYRATLALEVL